MNNTKSGKIFNWLLVLLTLACGTAIAAPPIPTNPTPGSTISPGPTTSSSTVTLIWSASVGATSYGVSVRDIAANALVVSTTTTTTSYTASLSVGKQYRWNVNACNSAGCSSYTTVLYFQTPTTQAQVTITSISGWNAGDSVVNGLWTGQPTVTNKPTTYTNKYLNYLALESQNSNATFTIKGSNFGTKSGTVSLLSNVGTPIIGVTVTITSWSNTSITFSAKSLYTFTNSAGGAVAVSTQPNATTFSGTGAAKLSVLGFVGTISTRGYGQCVWYVADQRLAASILIPPSAYSTTATIGATYVPQIHDALVYGTKHVAIITSEPIKTVNGTTTTWTFTVGEMNYNWGEAVGSSSKTFSVKSSVKSGVVTTVVTTNIGSLAGSSYAATGYWR